MKKLCLFLSLCLAVGASLKAQTSTYALNVGDFNELKVEANLNIDYRCSTDSAGMAVFTCDKAMVNKILFENNKSRLKIQLVTDEGMVLSKLPTVTVYSSFLQKVENSGDSLTRVLAVTPGASFKARIIGNGRMSVSNVHATTVEGLIDTGSGRLTITGKAQNAKLRNTGTGAIEAGSLKATNVNCTLLGTGSIDCWATESLTIKGASSGKVFYKGTPKTVKNMGIGVKAVALDTAD